MNINKVCFRMNSKVKQKLFSAGVTGLMVMSLVAPSAFASTNNVKVKNAGAFSSSYVKTVNVNKNHVNQGNFTIAGTSIDAVSNTGGNHSSFNTKGDSSIKTGDSKTKVNVTVGGSKNVDNSTNNTDNSTSNVNVNNNGAFSSSYVKVVNVNSNSVSQFNGTTAFTNVNAVSNTGGNSASFNTNGDNSITTGDSTTGVNVTVGGGTNVNN